MLLFLLQWEIPHYHRRLKLAAYYQQKDDFELPLLPPKSDYTPPNCKLPFEITALINADVNHFDTKLQICHVPNLSTEARAIKELSCSKQIIIKPAAKGSTMVVMDREQCLWVGYRQLK